MAETPPTQPGISAREKAALALMAVGFVSFVGGIACISQPWAAIVGGALLLTAGVVADRMS